MIALLPLLADPVDLALQVEEPIEAENAALRHQLIVLQRRMRGRVQFTNRDRPFLGRCVSSSANDHNFGLFAKEDPGSSQKEECLRCVTTVCTTSRTGLPRSRTSW